MKKGKVNLLRIHLDIPDWLDWPFGLLASSLGMVLVFGYLGLTIFLAVKVSLWFLFMLAITPSAKIKFGKGEKNKVEIGDCE